MAECRENVTSHRGRIALPLHGQTEAHEPWLTKRELAAELKVSTRTIERLRVPAQPVGRQNRYKLSEAEAFLAGRDHPGEVVELRPA